MNCIFYTDTLFANNKSIVGNTCAHIFTDGEFVQIIPMQSKPEAGTTLDKINQDVGVANKIFIENAFGKTGYNTEIQRVSRLASMETRTTDPYSPW